MTARERLKQALYGALYLTGSAERRVCAIALYHSVGNATRLSVPLPEFERQMDWLREHFRTVRVRDLPDVVPGPDREDVACVTFDDGHRDNYEVALPVLERTGIKATFFVTAGLLGEMFRSSEGLHPMMTPAQVQAVASQGHEIGAHTMTHPRLTALTPEAAAGEIANSKQCLEALIGSPVVSFAYPKGLWNTAVRQLTEDNGFRCAVTTRPGLVDARSDWLTLPRIWISPQTGIGHFKARLSHATDRYERIRGRRSRAQ